MPLVVRAWPDGVLGVRHGGTRQLKSGYCIFYETSPRYPEMLICTGGGIWEACPDRTACVLTCMLRTGHKQEAS